VRLTADGRPDETFGTGGTVITDFAPRDDEAHAVAVQADGKIVVAGLAVNAGTDADLLLARYNPDGSLDDTFGTGGRVITPVAGYDVIDALAVQPDGKLVIAGSTVGPAGSDTVLGRYNPDGSLDSTFGGSGGVSQLGLSTGDDLFRAVTVLPDGRILA